MIRLILVGMIALVMMACSSDPRPTPTPSMSEYQAGQYLATHKLCSTIANAIAGGYTLTQLKIEFLDVWEETANWYTPTKGRQRWNGIIHECADQGY